MSVVFVHWTRNLNQSQQFYYTASLIIFALFRSETFNHDDRQECYGWLAQCYSTVMHTLFSCTDMHAKQLQSSHHNASTWMSIH